MMPHIPAMVWDLRGALLKKEERESARLAEFEFRHRARTIRLTARAIGLDETNVVAKAATVKPGTLIGWLAEQHDGSAEEFATLHQQSSEEARRQLIEELGDPTPHRLL